MNIFNHIKLINIIKILLYIPLAGTAFAFPSLLSFGICLIVFILLLVDLFLIHKAEVRYSNLYRSAYYDSLTNIPNRLSADIFVSECSSPDNISVIIADLDGLKFANDTFGHHTGDILIKDFAALFADSACPEGFAARNGGDEFLAVFPEDGDGSHAIRFCGRLKQAVYTHNISAEHPISYSIGYACSHDDSHFSIQRLISIADNRMYEQKRKKKQASSKESICIQSVSEKY